MKYDPHKHHRRSIRLKGYDYSRAGLYFITICTQDRAHLFGRIEGGILKLNPAGRMVAKWYGELQHKFLFIRCHEMVVMPNHFHCILEIVNPVGADLFVCPDAPRVPVHGNRDGDSPGPAGDETRPAGPCPVGDKMVGEHVGSNENRGGEQFIRGEHVGSNENPGGEQFIRGEHVGSPLHVVLQWFKTMTTNEYIRGVKTLGWERFNGKLWQRNYWEHIIRHEQSYRRIAQYIKDNPQNWRMDRLHKQHK